MLFSNHFAMPSFCCIPNCNQKGYTLSSGGKVSFFNFPKAPLIRKQWIHVIRREEGKDFVITERTKVCSLHFTSEDLRKSINGRVYIKEGAIPSKFDWSGPSPKKRKAPTEQQPLPAKKKTARRRQLSSLWSVCVCKQWSARKRRDVHLWAKYKLRRCYT